MRADGWTPRTPPDLWYLRRNEDGSDWEPHQFTQTPFIERSAKLAPDGRHVAYVSNESGQLEIYVQPFPEGGRRSTVSTNGGRQPRWSRDGKELFYVEGATLIAVPVSAGSRFSMGLANRLFEHSSLMNTVSYPMYDVSANGQRFVVAEPVGAPPPPPPPPPPPEPSIQVVQNWFAEFKDRQAER